MQALNLYEIVVDRYLDAKWILRDFLTIDVGGGEKRQIGRMREAKQFAKGIPHEEWKMASSINRTGWENQLAFELSILLERLGISVFAGGLSPRVLLPIAADQILDDWLLCESWVQSFREKQNTYRVTGNPDYPYHRRHGEWLAFLAFLWMRKHFSGYDSVLKFSILKGGDSVILSKFLFYTRAELDLLDPTTKSEINSILGVEI